VKNIETLIDEGGDISIGPVGAISCVAAATNGATCLAMLVRRDGERLDALMSETAHMLLQLSEPFRPQGLLAMQEEVEETAFADLIATFLHVGLFTVVAE
jgi:hypothetical protein